MTETALYEQVAQYLNLKHPGLIYHFDLSGMWTPSHKQRNLYGRLNARAFPDLVIYKPSSYGQALPLSDDNLTVQFVYRVRGNYHGLALELKKEGTRLKKKDGSWASDHIAEQAAVLNRLADEGYVAQFAVGFDETIELIESYLGASDEF